MAYATIEELEAWKGVPLNSDDISSSGVKNEAGVSISSARFSDSIKQSALDAGADVIAGATVHKCTIASGNAVAKELNILWAAAWLLAGTQEDNLEQGSRAYSEALFSMFNKKLKLALKYPVCFGGTVNSVTYKIAGE